MNKGLSLGYSSAAEMSHSEEDWGGKVRKIGLFLVVVAALGLFFGYITHSLDSHKILPASGGEVGWDVTAE